MPGLLNTDGHPVSETPIPPPVIPISHLPNSNHTSSSSSAAAQPARSPAPSLASAPAVPGPLATGSAPPTAHTQATPAPQAPRRPPQISRPPQTPQPSRTTIATPVPPPARPSQPPQTSQPERPQVEPLTPPLKPTQFPAPRQTYTYSNQPAQTIAAPPPPQPIDFDSNPDVLALKSAMSILQMQSKRAQADMVALQKAKNAALAQPDSFIADLTGGKIKQGVTPGDGSSSDSSSDGEDGGKVDAISQHRVIPDSRESTHMDAMQIDGQPVSTQSPQGRPWTNLPTAQDIYRCPPINWSQYAVASDSLDRLHNQQLRAPTQGTPATLTPDGRYEFKGGPGRQEEIVGIAAPYNPLKDRIDAPAPKRRKEQQQQQQQPPKGSGQ